VEIHNAGHLPVIVAGHGGVLRVESTGLPLGLFHDIDFSATRLHLESGDTMFLYTDGLSEARRDQDEYGVERVAHLVRQAARQPAELIAACLDDLRRFVDGPAFDDLTMLAIQRKVPASA
jgi:phosphoserine phosphatase RsbU/P